jgi:hypothetical protein
MAQFYPAEWDTDPDPACFVNADPDPDPDPGSDEQKLDKTTAEIFFTFLIKNCNLLIPRPQ